MRVKLYVQGNTPGQSEMQRTSCLLPTHKTELHTQIKPHYFAN